MFPVLHLHEFITMHLEQIAKSFIEGKAIEIEGGNYEMDKEWYGAENVIN